MNNQFYRDTDRSCIQIFRFGGVFGLLARPQPPFLRLSEPSTRLLRAVSGSVADNAVLLNFLGGGGVGDLFCLHFQQRFLLQQYVFFFFFSVVVLRSVRYCLPWSLTKMTIVLSAWPLPCSASIIRPTLSSISSIIA